jgi:hypothetical protein
MEQEMMREHLVCIPSMYFFMYAADDRKSGVWGFVSLFIGMRRIEIHFIEMHASKYSMLTPLMLIVLHFAFCLQPFSALHVP